MVDAVAGCYSGSGVSQGPDAVGTPKPRIAAAILAYNCAPYLRKAYAMIPKDVVDDVFITDDGSRDGTYEVARDLGIDVFRHAPNRGYGGNLKEGLRIGLSRGADYIVEVHGDGQFDARAIIGALPLIKHGVEFIIGSRFIIPGRARENGMPLIRFLANRGLSLVDRSILRLPFSEFHTGFRIYSRTLLDRVPWQENSDDYLFSFEIIAQAAYVGAQVGEVPVDADYRSDHQSHSIRGASVYAVKTFGVLGEFALARAGLRLSRRFPQRERGAGHGRARESLGSHALDDARFGGRQGER